MKNRRKIFLFSLLGVCIAVFCGIMPLMYSKPETNGMVCSAPEASRWDVGVAPHPVMPEQIPEAPYTADSSPVVLPQRFIAESKLAANKSDGKVFQVQRGRKQSFEAVLALNVTGNEYSAVKQVLALAEKFSGYSVYSNLNNVRVKIPVQKAEVFMLEVEKLGTVTRREVTSQDVTAEYMDLELRCKNLRSLRDRFAELLKKAVKIEDMLKIESELARVTTELEEAQGRLNLLKNKVDMVRISVTFNSVAVANNESIPVDWVRKLGDVIFREDFSASQSKLEKFALNVTLPAGFITLYRNENVLQAINADNCKLQMKHYNDLPGATAEFYSKFIKQQLQQSGFVSIECKDIVLPENHCGVAFSATRGDYTYNVAILFYQAGWLTRQNKVLVVEVLGKNADMKSVNMNDITKVLKF